MFSKHCNIHKIIKRTYVTNGLSSKEVRQKFLDYFCKQNDHTFIRSSPVVPYCDPTIAFVNAGMNQFKNVFLGKTSARCSRAANSQKCVRVGGKHNDLTVVGTDSYHHTFFEMLGNWSFDDYFKTEACQMAWDLITREYNINSERLYVTYFAGDKSFGLLPDLECKEIWLSLGVPEDRIIPFGMKENFWEMGSTGPCGPCTEIHIDHVSDRANRSHLVNVDGQSQVTELWNLVFIEYNRHEDGTVSKLPLKHIDTGMGMERLTAIIQNRRSNYDTDLFLPLFNHIQKVAKVPAYKGTFSGDTNTLDTAYRILADHSRMITACLSDGMLPDQNHKLRRVMRKAILVAEQNFKTKHLLREVLPQVVDSLGGSYPEMELRLPQTLSILQYEHELFDALRSSSSDQIGKIMKSNPKFEEIDLVSTPGLISAYNDLIDIKDTLGNKTLPGNFMFKLYDTYGINEALIEKLADMEGLAVDTTGFQQSLQNAKQRTKSLFNTPSEDDCVIKSKITDAITATRCDSKYAYKFDAVRNMYTVKPVQAKVLAIINGDEMMESIQSNGGNNNNCHIILDQSNFYCESGGQIGDTGRIVGNNETLFRVSEVSDYSGRLLHSGRIETINGILRVGDAVHVFVDNERRTGATLNHTATHIINACIRHSTNSVVYQKSSHVNPDILKFDAGIVGVKLSREMIGNIEARAREIVKTQSAVETEIIDIDKLYASNEVVLVPGEIYPESGLRLLTIQNDELLFSSKELCCGTHALNTLELADICIVNVKQSGRGSYLFTVMAGPNAQQAHTTGQQMMADVEKIQLDLKTGKQKLNDLESRVSRIKHILSSTDVVMPFVVKHKCLDILNDISKQIKDVAKESLRSFIECEMKTVLEQSPPDTHPFIVHFMSSGFLLENISLQKATRLCTDRPILVMSLTEGMVKARCCVPKDFAESGLRADEWVSTVASVFKAQIAPPKGMSPDEVCNMKAKKMQNTMCEDRIDLAMEEAKKFAETFFKFENLSKRSHK